MTVHINDPEVHMYDVPGHTLTEAGTVIASMAEAGKAEWWPQFVYESDNGVVSSVTVTVPQRKTMPRWQGYADASQSMKDEWDRFWRALETHEQGHFDLVTSYLSNLDLVLVGHAVDDVQRVFTDAIAALDAASSAYDVHTSHGVTQGTILGLGVEAAPTP
jgi:predicted secreted Zn-dependent protease